jgi:recombination protein RecA
MHSANTIRLQIESTLAHRIPSALTPQPRLIRAHAPTGIAQIDAMLDGGLPLGAITEMVGAESSGRTSVALSFVAGMTQEGKACAWIDVSDALHAESAAAAGVDLSRLLWVRCGVTGMESAEAARPKTFALPQKYFIAPPTIRGLHGGGCGPHPRTEVKGLSNAVHSFLSPKPANQETAKAQPRVLPATGAATQTQFQFESRLGSQFHPVITGMRRHTWSRIAQALRVADLLLQGGGFSCLVLDLGSVAPEFALRVSLATWFRYRASVEQSQSSMVLLTQHACAKSSAGLVLNFQDCRALCDEATVFTGTQHRVEVSRERFAPSTGNVIPMRKLPQSERGAAWRSRTAWAGAR